MTRFDKHFEDLNDKRPKKPRRNWPSGWWIGPVTLLAILIFWPVAIVWVMSP